LLAIAMLASLLALPSLAQVKKPAEDFADGLAGGPDFWEATNLAAGSKLRMRKTASAQSEVVASLSGGTILKNMGCKIVGGNRWCEVSFRDKPSVVGWVFGKYLREANIPGSTSDALVPGTNYHAVGQIPCALKKMPETQNCDFGVTRGMPGVATVFITLPNKFVRVISFDGTTVVPASGVVNFTANRTEDRALITINDGDEIYTIFGAVVSGG
jgi:hypothetical protein